MTEPDDDLVLEDHLDAESRDVEAPDADAVEQAMPANPAEERVTVHRSLEANDWDALEQSRVVDLDDDYR